MWNNKYTWRVGKNPGTLRNFRWNQKIWLTSVAFMFQYSSFMASWLHFTSSRVLETCISLHFPWSYKITELGASKKCKCNLSLQERLTWNVKLKDIKRQYCVVRGGKYLYSGDRAAVKVSRYPHVISLISYPCRLDTRGATGRCLRSSPRSGRKIDRFTARLQILRSQCVINSFTKKQVHERPSDCGWRLPPFRSVL